MELRCMIQTEMRQKKFIFNQNRVDFHEQKAFYISDEKRNFSRHGNVNGCWQRRSCLSGTDDCSFS